MPITPKTLEAFDHLPPKQPQTRQKKYPWDEWAASISQGRSYVLRQNRDFSSAASNFVGYFRRQMEARGLKFKASVRAEGVYVESLQPPKAAKK